MKAYSVRYIYNGITYSKLVDATNPYSAKNKVGRTHGLKAAESQELIKILSISVVGYY